MANTLPGHCVLPRREARHGRIYRLCVGSAREGPDTPFYDGENHQMHLCIVVCVVSAREGPSISCYFGEKHTVNVYIAICVDSEGRPRHCVVFGREAPRERIYRYLCSVCTGWPRHCVFTSARNTQVTYMLCMCVRTGRPGHSVSDRRHPVNVLIVIILFPRGKAPAVRYTLARSTN